MNLYKRSILYKYKQFSFYHQKEHFSLYGQRKETELRALFHPQSQKRRPNMIMVTLHIVHELLGKMFQ